MRRVQPYVDVILPFACPGCSALSDDPEIRRIDGLPVNAARKEVG